MWVIAGDFPGIFPSQLVSADGKWLEEKLMMHGEWVVVPKRLDQICFGLSDFQSEMDPNNKEKDQGARCLDPMKWWTIGLNLWMLLDRLNFAECNDFSGNIEMISHDADCFQGSQPWCEPFDGHTMRKITFWSLNRFLKHSSFWLGLRGLIYFEFRWGVPLPSIEILGFVWESNFAGIPLIKIPRKNAARVRFSHQFSAVFQDFPPTSSSPLLQIHLAEDRQQKAIAWRVM